MSSFINFITICFVFLICYQIFLAFLNENSMMEAFENAFKPYDTNNQSNSMILEQQNAGNINVLKQQLDSLLSLKIEVKQIKTDITNLQEQMNQMVLAQQQYTNQMTGGKIPNITV
jgi:hypothetical protein